MEEDSEIEEISQEESYETTSLGEQLVANAENLRRKLLG